MATAPEFKIVKEELDDDASWEPGWERYQLYVNGHRSAVLYHKDGKVELDIQFAGAFGWQESRASIEGLVKLKEVGDQLFSGARKVDGLHQPTDEEIDMAKAKKTKAKGKTAPKKSGEAKAPRETAAGMFRELILKGGQTDDQIFAAVQKKFNLGDEKRSYVAWYRNQLKKDGKNPPAAKE